MFIIYSKLYSYPLKYGRGSYQQGGHKHATLTKVLNAFNI